MAHDLTDRDRISFTNPRGGEFLEKYRSTLAVLTVASCAAALLLSLLLGPASLTAIAIAFALGLYSPLRRTLIKSGTKDEKGITPGKRPKETDITTSLSWAMGLAGTSAAAGGAPLLPSLLAGAMVFMVSLLRLNIMGLRDIQGDKMLGKMTQAVRLGEEKTIALIYRLTAVLAALPAAGAAVKIFPAYGYLFAFLPVYILILMKLRRADALYLTGNFLTSLDAFMLIYLAAASYRFIAA
jgi:4-hydroxybenzoate polyprenyltransferase